MMPLKLAKAKRKQDKQLGKEIKADAVASAKAKREAELKKGPDWDKVAAAQRINDAKRTLKAAKRNLPGVIKLIKHLSVKTVKVAAQLEKLAPKLDYIAKALRYSSKPFGGIQVIFVGDFCQLPPVVQDKKEAYPFCFLSPLWEKIVKKNIYSV